MNIDTILAGSIANEIKRYSVLDVELCAFKFDRDIIFIYKYIVVTIAIGYRIDRETVWNTTTVL